MPFTMDSLIPISPGASCGSPFSDVTSVSVFSDTQEPVSPEFPLHLDNLTAQLSVQSNLSSSSSTSSDMIPAEDGAPEVNSQALAEYNLYQNFQVGSDAAINSHLDHLVHKFKAGQLRLPTPNVIPESPTPYSDIVQPKKPKKPGVIVRPMNAFMYFAKVERGHLIASQPELHNAQISKHLGKLWKILPADVKDPYIKTAELLKRLHLAEYPSYKYQPRKRKASGNSSKKNDGGDSTTTSTSSSGVFDAADAGGEGYAGSEDLAGVLQPKPAKRQRKSGTSGNCSKAPRNRGSSRKPRQSAQLMRSSSLMTDMSTDLNVKAVLQHHVRLPLTEQAAVAVKTRPSSSLPLAIALATTGVKVAAQPAPLPLPQPPLLSQPPHLALAGEVRQEAPGPLVILDSHDDGIGVDLSMFEPGDQEYQLYGMLSSAPQPPSHSQQPPQTQPQQRPAAVEQQPVQQNPGPAELSDDLLPFPDGVMFDEELGKFADVDYTLRSCLPSVQNDQDGFDLDSLLTSPSFLLTTPNFSAELDMGVAFEPSSQFLPEQP